MNQHSSVLVVPPSYLADERVVGGGERYALEYARALAEITPTTLALFGSTPGVRELGKLRVRTFPLERQRSRLVFTVGRDSWRELGTFDVIHSMIFPSPLSDLLMLSARSRGQRMVLTDVGGGIPCLSTRLQRLHPRADPNRLAHGLALLSSYAATFYREWSQPQTVLYGGVNLNEFSVTPLPADGYALFVGRLLPHKGIRELIEALPPELPLHVVGRPYDAAYLARLQEAASGKRVRFIHDADDAELHRQLAGARLVLQPSIPAPAGGLDKSELLGLVALEGMASGRPVVVTRTTSLPELVVDGETGLVVEPGDSGALRRAMELLMGDRVWAQAMGSAARRHIERSFTWDRVARRGLALYEQLLGTGASRAPAPHANGARR